jgi:hypothetical protein
LHICCQRAVLSRMQYLAFKAIGPIGTADASAAAIYRYLSGMWRPDRLGPPLPCAVGKSGTPQILLNGLRACRLQQGGATLWVPAQNIPAALADGNHQLERGSRELGVGHTPCCRS